jgi:hypothetical protein
MAARWCEQKKRGKGGGGPASVSAWREKEGEKWGPGVVINSVGRPAMAPDRRARATPLRHEQGRATGVSDTGEGTRVADAWDQGEVGPGVSGGVWERAKRREAGRRRGADTWARAAQRRVMQFKLSIQNLKFLGLQKFKTKYGWKVFEIRNNFPYRDFLIFRMDFELKFREFL